MTPQEKILLKEKLELILPNWDVYDSLSAYTTKLKITITETQLNQIAVLGLFVNTIYMGESGSSVSFSGVNQ